MQKRIAGKQNRFDEPAPQVAHTLMEMENQSRTAAIITRDQITLGQRIGEGAHGSVYEGTWANIHGSVGHVISVPGQAALTLNSYTSFIPSLNLNCIFWVEPVSTSKPLTPPTSIPHQSKLAVIGQYPISIC